jgi:membrane dipeptidase
MDPVPIFDGHNDVLLKLHYEDRGEGRSFFETGQEGHFDLPRAREGGVTGGLFAIYVPPDPAAEDRTESKHLQDDTGDRLGISPALTESYARETALDILAHFHRLGRDDRVDVVRSVSALRRSVASERLTAVAHLEGAAPVGHDLEYLDLLYEAGLRSIGLVWSRPNAFGHGVPFHYPHSPDIGPGLTDAGRDLVEACNRRGILIDLAHINTAGFWEVAELTSDPLVVTHTAVHDICPSTRNLTDDQIDAVGASGGIVGLTFNVSDLRPDGESETDVEVDLLVRHIEYLVDRIGIDHVALGSDFDGATMPDSLPDVTAYQDLIAAFRAAGFTDDEIDKLARENLLRVLEATWQ